MPRLELLRMTTLTLPGRDVAVGRHFDRPAGRQVVVRITCVAPQTHDEPADRNRNDRYDDEPQTAAPLRGNSAFFESVY